MIKKYNQFLNESLLDHLKGPSEEEIYNNILSLPDYLFVNKYDKNKLYFTGRHKEELYNRFKDILLSYEPKKMLDKSVEYNFLEGVKKAFEFFDLDNKCLPDKLEDAIRNRCFDIALFLLEQGVQLKGYGTETILKQLCLNDNQEILKLVLKNGLDEYYIKDIDLLEYSFANPYENYNIVKILLEYGVGFNDESIEKVLKKAIKLNRQKIVYLLLEYGADLTKLPIGLIKKLYINSSPKIRKKIKKIPGILKKLNIEYYDEKYKDFINESILDELKGPTEEEMWNNIKNLPADDALLTSTENGLLKGVKIALKRGANIHVFSDEPMINAAGIGHLDIVKFFVEECGFDEYEINIALRHASEHGHLDIVKYCIERGADIHTMHDYVVRKAASEDHLDVVKYAVEHGADIHSTEDYALRFAAFWGNLDVVKYLVEQGADIHAKDDFAMEKAIKNKHEDVIEYLEQQIKKEKLTESILDELKGPSDEEILNNLKELSPDELLEKSVKISFLKGVKKALELGADIHSDDDYALKFTALNNHLDILKYLVENGANIHAGNDISLRNAAFYGYLDIVIYLVEHGADIYSNNIEVLKYAYKFNHINMIKYLKSKMEEK